MSSKVCEFLATFFYVGRFPVAPGSLASLVSVLIYIIFWGQWNLYLLVLALVTLAGFWAAGKVEKLSGEKDPGCVVIDEVAGVLIAFFLLPPTIPVILTAFFLFRAFDMFKIYPIHKIEEIPGSAGIMLDDLMAGLYTNIVMHLAIRMVG